MGKKISGKYLFMAVLMMVLLASTGCSKALETLMPDPEELVKQGVQALMGGNKDGEKSPEELPVETKKEEESTESIENTGKPAGEESFQETEASRSSDLENGTDAAAGRIVTEEQFLREYAKQCLQQEWSLYDYHEKNYMIYREPGAYPGLCFSDTGMLEDIGYDGIISSAICDFDQDGHQELLILRLVQNPPTSQEDMILTDLEASMYEIEGEQVVLADRKPLFDGLRIGMNAFRMEAFVKNTTDGVRLFCETDGSTFIAADGHFWSLCGMEYDGGRFWELIDTGFGGSSWEPEDVLSYVDDSRRLGLNVTSLLNIEGGSPSILSQDEGTLCLVSIRRQVTLNYKDYGFRRFRPGDTLEYGSTEIRNKVEGRMILYQTSHPNLRLYNKYRLPTRVLYSYPEVWKDVVFIFLIQRREHQHKSRDVCGG